MRTTGIRIPRLAMMPISSATRRGATIAGTNRAQSRSDGVSARQMITQFAPRMRWNLAKRLRARVIADALVLARSCCGLHNKPDVGVLTARAGRSQR